MKTQNKTNRILWLYVVTAVVLLIYYVGLKKLLVSATAMKIEMISLLGLVVILAVQIVILLISLLVLLFSRKQGKKLAGGRGQMIVLSVIVLLIALIVGVSQWTAHTDPILGENGKPLDGSIASVEKIKLGGTNQWLIIRGEDVNKPVLLFLSGGPGASEAARVIRFNSELEKHFVVVIWEQRGCGKSYPSLNPKSALTLNGYASDIIELTNLLRDRFDEKKIYLVGHSWGSIIGVHAVQQAPELFHAYVGSAQMVDVLETDQLIFQMVMDHSIKSGDTSFVKTLEAQGVPPYFGKSPIKPYSTLFGREYALFEYPNIVSEEYRKDGDILELMLKQSEYGWLDRIHYLLGLMNTFNVVYPQLQEMDFRLDANQLDLPVYLILGRHDLNNPIQIPEEYFNLLQAPHKELIVFEKSGHGMIWEEPDKFTDVLVNTVLAQTYQP
ncbi:MAG: alpha/beta hydrolase [Chloroflexi bacterium HGW-Chloroflexi-4]|jgi:pimeloyl-ACP methyl ester carboxylesterase|nr:MAG: alpha/beta hydrolase [Chloroflexi bacterium HGW-Chloroflexi-4]